jgi:hypothetical protein
MPENTTPFEVAYNLATRRWNEITLEVIPILIAAKAEYAKLK